MRAWIAVVALLVGCGRLGYERRATDGGVDGPGGDGDGGVDSAIDAAIDARIPVCPAGMTELTAGSSTCIEQTERGDLPWTTAKSDCEALGRRLCTDAEWFLGCTDGVGMVDMTDNSYEWVAEEAGGIAQKRGPDACTDTSSHQVVDPYEYRCCGPKI